MLLLACLGIAGCGLNGPAHAPSTATAAAVVDMGFTSYDPPTVTIRAGQTVEWRNTSIITHTVTAGPSGMNGLGNEGAQIATTFNSGDVAAGNIYLRKFDTPGTYRYLCTHHEELGMVGTVIVTP